MTNARAASWSLPGRPPVVLRLLASRTQLMIAVWDAAPGPPRPRPYAVDAETGRGLHIVAMLAGRWGYCHPQRGGKVVWAIVDIR